MEIGKKVNCDKIEYKLVAEYLRISMKKSKGSFYRFRQGILWSRDLKNLDYEKDARYIIHHVLMYGSLRDIKALMKIYSPARVKDVFLKKPLPVYTKPALNFLAKFILEIDVKKIDRSKYVKTLY